MTAFVPPDLTGLWRREVITTPAGHRDETTRVLWLQTRSWYADLRVRADRPDRPGAIGFADYTDAELVQLAAVQGFAGQLTARDGICLWRRDLDYQPSSDDLDEARFAIEGEVMIEDGIHSDYQEIWRREPRSLAPLAAFELTEDTAQPYAAGLLVVAGDHFMEIRNRLTPLPRGKKLAEVVTAALEAGDRDAAVAALSMRISLGRIDAGAWSVTLSSYPWLEGRPLWSGGDVAFDKAAGTITCRAAATRQVWSLIDAAGDLADLPAPKVAAAVPANGSD
jgi:hypothetical protein